MQFERLISQKNLDLAWSRIATATNYQYKRFYRPALLALEPAREEVLRRLRHRLLGAWQPTSPVRVYLPKPSGLQRPLSLLSLEDQLVLQAVANAFAEKLRNRRAKVSGKVVFSNILNDQPGSIFFIQRWQKTYSRFQSVCEGHYKGGFRWVAHFDLAAFYDTISHDLLVRCVSPRGGNQETWDRVKSWFRIWSAEASEQPFGHGIPQGPIASDFLAECLLLPIDEQLQRSGIRYVRYVDDIRLFGRSRAEAQQAVLLLERLCRNIGLIPQGEKYAINRARSLSDALGSLPSLAPPNDEGGNQQLEAIEAERLFEESIIGRPYQIGNKSKARYVLYRAPKTSRLLRLVVKLLPRHPEHVDALVHYLRVCGKSIVTERTCRKLLEEGMPYQYVRGELWHLLADIASDRELGELVALAQSDLRRDPTAALAWGAMRFLLQVESRGGCSSTHRVRHQPPLIQALLVEAIPDSRYVPNGPIATLLRKGSQEAGASLAGELIARGLTHRDFGLRVIDLPPIVQEVFRALGLVNRQLGVKVDQIGEILSRRFGIATVTKWRHVLQQEYAHALQILSQAEIVFDASRSSWLQYQDSFNDLLVRKFIEFLHTRGLAGGRSTVNGNGVRLDYGILLDPTQAFAQTFPSISEPLRNTHKRRNRLPGSHPYDKATGAQNRFLTRAEQQAIGTDLTGAYADLLRIVNQTV